MNILNPIWFRSLGLAPLRHPPPLHAIDLQQAKQYTTQAGTAHKQDTRQQKSRITVGSLAVVQMLTICCAW